MGWDIKNDGFGVVLSPELPALMRERLGEALFPFLAREGLSLQDFDGFLLHPGGSKVLDTAEEALGTISRPGPLLVGCFETLRQHVVSYGAVRAQRSLGRRCSRPLLARGVRPRFFRLFHRA